MNSPPFPKITRSWRLFLESEQKENGKTATRSLPIDEQQAMDRLTDDILSEMLLFFSTIEVVAFGQTSQYHQVLCLNHTSRRVYRLLFIHLGRDTDLVVAILRRTRSVIGGSVAMQCGDNSAMWRTENLNIVAPLGALRLWAWLMFVLGYRRADSSVVRGPAINAHCLFQREGRSVTVTESSVPHILPVILSAPCTCAMTYVSTSSIVALYPRMSFDGKCVSRTEMPKELAFIDHRSRGVVFHESTSSWTEPC
ncbi:hypothetical protein Hypma_009993 [Hypsizygus marmoreus]|uniref:Uncharacterized protein n=1 Tax=Hypsizygus marmoreus TaxID=39966 RepID=A0A369JJZ6_HYPMA|nr:hypothetical protein Hypma_009993 [Hypsizygus marmoreus]